MAAWLGLPAAGVEIAAASDGAPEARVDGERGPGLAVAEPSGRARARCSGRGGHAIGCDLELIEPRSRAFVADWLAPAEQALVADACASDRDLLANLLWTAKEAAAKARREGLRLDPRHAVATPTGIGSTTPGWRRLQVVWSDGGGCAAGWWRGEPGWVMAIAGEPVSGVPRALDAVATEPALDDGP